MAELGTAFAVVALADQCLKYEDKFVKRCKDYLHAEQESVEILISIEAKWLKVRTQIGILKRIAVAGQLSEELQSMQSQVLSQLEGKLKTASLIINQLRPINANQNNDDRDITTMMKGLGGMKALSKMKYVSKKKALMEIVEEIEKWQARYDPSWLLIMQMSSKHIDEELEQQERKPRSKQIPIIIAAKGIRDATRASQDAKLGDHATVWISGEDINLKPTLIQHSSIEISKTVDEKAMVLIDTMISNPAANVNSTTKEVRNLARILAEVDPSTFSLLKCQGVIKVAKPNTLHPLFDFKFIFKVPSQLSNPKSLRAVLLSETPYPLDERMNLAKKLASSVLFVHTVQFVHKNIRPETLIVFQNEDSRIGAPYLAGFEKFRIEDGNTYLVGDNLWDHNLYRHPSRQGTHPEVHYQMQHDIYSLGVVLVEIGLWTSFSLPSTATDPSLATVPSPIFAKGTAPCNSKNPLGSPSLIKAHLESLATAELPSRMGKRYTEVVLLCLRCLDQDLSLDNDNDTSGFGFGVGGKGKGITDEDGVVIGVRYIENVLQKMQEITV